MKFFKRVKQAIFNFEEYVGFADEQRKITIKYLLILITIFTFLAVIPYMYALAQPEVYELLLTKYSINMQEAFSQYNIYVICIIVWVILYIEIFIIYLLKVALDILIIFLLGIIISKVVGIKLKRRAILKMSVYAITLPVILLLIYTFLTLMLNVQMTYFDFAYNTIAYIYIITAIMMMRAEMIKTKMEVEKIAEEQKNVKKELKEEKEKEKEKQKEENKKEKKEEKKGEKEAPETP